MRHTTDQEAESAIEASSDHSRFKNAVIGEDTLVEPDVEIGWRYHKDCGKTRIGRHGIIRKGTIIYGDVEIGDYFQTVHYAVIRAKVKIGDYCCLCNHVTVEGIVRMGDGVRLMSNTYVPSRTWFGDNVFVGPGVVFMNDRYPGRVEVKQTPRGATIEDDVMVGGGCLILPGITIGERSFIAAGTTVTKDVPAGSFVVGTPGRIEPLPDKLDMPNSRRLTLQPTDFWHPDTPDLRIQRWPDDWPDG